MYDNPLTDPFRLDIRILNQQKTYNQDPPDESANCITLLKCFLTRICIATVDCPIGQKQ